MFRSTLAITLASVFAAVAAPSFAAEVEAFQNATVQPNGVRTGGSGINFFNVEGSDFGNFSSYGVARFDVSAAKAGFDALYGAGNWLTASVTLRLTQSNAAFTADGGVAVYFTGDDAVSLVAPSPLRYPLAGDFPDAVLLTSYAFQEVSSGTVEDYSLYSLPISGIPAANALADDIRTDDTVTLILADTTAGVAATYAGYNNNTYAGPTLMILAAPVPEPETYALMGAGLLLVSVARGLRRRG